VTCALLALAIHAGVAFAAPPELTTTLRAKDQALLDGIALGDRALWARTLNRGTVYVLRI
jgi:hypothetical protein